MSDTTAPEWLVVGAPVVVYTSHSTASRRAVRSSRIEKLNKTTFRVEGEESLFDIRGQASRGTGTWDAGRYVVPADSETGRHEVAQARIRARRKRAGTAVDEWRKTPTRETVLAAIEALQATLVDHPEESP